MAKQSSVIVIFVLALLIAACTASIHIKNHPKSLIYYTKPDFKTTYSTFLASLEDKGHILTLVNPIDDVVPLKNYDRLLFDNIFVFAPTISNMVQGFPKASEFLDFVEQGGSIFVAPTDGFISETFRDVALSYGIEYLPSSSTVINTLDPSNSILSIQLPNTTSEILGSIPAMAQSANNQIQTTGLGMAVIDNISYIKKVLAGSATMLVFGPESQQIYESGDYISFLSAVQLKNNARIIFLSDVSLLSDAFLSTPNTQNQLYLNTVCWVSHDCGYVRIKTLQHYMFKPTEATYAKNSFINHNRQQLFNQPDESAFSQINPVAYKVGENIHFDVVLERYDPYSKSWNPTQSDDVVFDMTMLHSFIRFPIELKSEATLEAKKTSVLADPSDRNANMPIQVTVPDTMGVYRVSLSTREAFSSALGSGISFLSTQEAPLNLPVRPYEHSEWARFLFVAYPYYLTMIITMGSFFVFSIAFLYTK